jgi:DNA processing protein
VVEATRRSGSLITARLAGEQGREVYAIPGSILSPQSRGCHALIRDGARLVETEADIFSELGHLGPDATRTPQSRGSGRTITLLDSMGYDPVAIDTLVERSGLTAGKVSSMLLRLELQGVVKTVTGGHYVRIE